ncbi:hypothetical protein GCM10028805_58260 [Spirosoma harenae]
MRKQLHTHAQKSQSPSWRSLISLLLLGISLVSFTDGTHKPGEESRKSSTPRPVKEQPVHSFDADPIKFLVRADKPIVLVGEEVTITLTAHYLNIHSALLFTTAGSTGFRLKAILPEGFVQTGGDYTDYIGTELSAVQPTVTYTIKGYFSKAGSKNEFRLLRGSYYADATSLFVEKARLVVQVNSAEAGAKQQKSARSAGALAFQIVGYDCNSGQLQYQFTGGNGSPIDVTLPGIVGGTMSADVVANYTFPGDGRVGRTVTGYAVQSGNRIDINFTNGCNLTTNPNPPSNPNPPTQPNNPSNGNLAFQIVSYDCNSGLLQYQITGGNGSPIDLVLPGIFAGTVSANTVATHTFPGDARTGRTVTGSANQSGNQIAISFTTGCNLTSSSNPPSNPNPPTQPTNPTGGSLAFQIVSYDCNSGVLQYQITGGDGSPINLSLPGIFAGSVNANMVFSYTFPGDARTGRAMTGSISQSGNQISISFTTGCNLVTNTPTTSTGSGNVGGGVDNPTGGCGTGSGLTGFYNNSTDLSKNLVAIRNDAQINFNWTSSPIPGLVTTNGFSISWYGQIEAPVSGNYTFKTNNDDGTRLWINGQILIDDWTGHGPTWQQGSIYLTAGQRYDIVIDFVNLGGGAQSQLYWEYPGQSLQLVPGCRLYPTDRSNQFDANRGNVWDYQLGSLTIRTDLMGQVYASNLRSWPWPKNPTKCPNLNPKRPKVPKQQKPKTQEVEEDEEECEEEGSPTPVIVITIWPIPTENEPSTPLTDNPRGGGGNPETNPINDTEITYTNQPIPTIANLEGIDCDKISGWAFAKNGGYAYLDIYIADVYGRFTKVTTIKANKASRPDVRAAFNNNPNIPLDCGFVWAIPDAYKDGHRLTVKVVPANNISPTGNIQNSPITSPSDCNKPTTTNPISRPPSWKDFPNLKDLSDQYFLNNYVVVGPERPINIADKLNCFGTVPADSKYKYSVTLYIDQPVNGTREIANFNPSASYRRPGHTYLGFERYDSTTNQVIRLVAGFYVKNELIAATSVSTDSDWGDDGGTPYDVSLKVNLSASQFKDVIYQIKNLGSPKYNLVDNNCTTFACKVISPYITLPDGQGYIGPLGKGYNPADLGQDLRENKSAYGNKITVTDNSVSPKSVNCN